MDWLPPDHLAWFVLDAVAELDLSEFVKAYRADGRGGAAHDPSMMAGLLLYAYCTGVVSSRKIEAACQVDVAFRVIAGNLVPDHTTIARFRATHADALAGLFTQVLAMCAEAGLDDTVVIVGLNDRFQIWSREKWAARRAEQRALAKAGMAQIGALKLQAQMKLAGGGS